MMKKLLVSSLLFLLSPKDIATTNHSDPTKNVRDDAGLFGEQAATVETAVANLGIGDYVVHVHTTHGSANGAESAQRDFDSTLGGFPTTRPSDGFLLVVIADDASVQLLYTQPKKLGAIGDLAKGSVDAPALAAFGKQHDFVGIAHSVLATISRSAETVRNTPEPSEASPDSVGAEPVHEAEPEPEAYEQAKPEPRVPALPGARIGSVAKAWRVAYAIRDVETHRSPRSYRLPGQSGEHGAYQFMPATWAMSVKAYAPQHAGIPQRLASPALQDYVAMRRIHGYVKQGHSVYEIALIWNGGSAKEKSGVNKHGVAYDSGAYARKVVAQYNANLRH